ncbi:MAG: hypothetical protein KDJ70_01220 [Candidatus Competibacteraceae bacterium]|nr:hypothetical protein [Candidatus Competibacteraceae bacterium]
MPPVAAALPCSIRRDRNARADAETIHAALVLPVDHAGQSPMKQDINPVSTGYGRCDG